MKMAFNVMHAYAAMAPQWVGFNEMPSLTLLQNLFAKNMPDKHSVTAAHLLGASWLGRLEGTAMVGDRFRKCAAAADCNGTKQMRLRSRHELATYTTEGIVGVCTV